MNEKLNVTFESEKSKGSNCICSCCHGEGKVIKVKIPHTLYYDGGKLKARYKEYWLCEECRDKLLNALKTS